MISPPVVQRIERRFPKANVGGSSPSGRAKVRCPKGFKFRIRQRSVFGGSYNSKIVHLETVAIIIELIHDGEMIGYVDVVKTMRSTWETHSSLDVEFHDRGFGVLLYAKAIDVVLKRGYKIESSHEPSEAAARVWKSRRLNELYDITHRNGRFTAKRHQ